MRLYLLSFFVLLLHLHWLAYLWWTWWLFVISYLIITGDIYFKNKSSLNTSIFSSLIHLKGDLKYVFVRMIFRYGTLYFILNKYMMYSKPSFGSREWKEMKRNEENIILFPCLGVLMEIMESLFPYLWV